jgi:RNA polymerase sigma factor (sigma-70 family)
MTHTYLRRIYTWRVPPNWSPRDWREELEAEAIAAAWEAEQAFDPTRGVPLPAFVHSRVLARALTRYRREWAYARRCKPQPENCDCIDTTSDGASALDVSESVRCCLARLPETQRWLIECLYWDGMTEVDVARLLSLSQQTINLRKRQIIERLRRGIGLSEKRNPSTESTGKTVASLHSHR